MLHLQNNQVSKRHVTTGGGTRQHLFEYCLGFCVLIVPLQEHNLRVARSRELPTPLTPFHYQGNVESMPLAQSKVTAQGQISVPARIRKKLGVGPGSVLEWDEEDGKVVIRRAGRYGWDDVRKALFPDGPPTVRTLEELQEGRQAYVRRKHARR